MKQHRQRHCRHCGDLFRPDPRNRRHQRYCCKSECRKASKTASQHRWLDKAQNRDYFRAAANVERVRTWRAAHPGYWRRPGAQSTSALQEDSSAQSVETHEKSRALAAVALQDLPYGVKLGLGIRFTVWGRPNIRDTSRHLAVEKHLGRGFRLVVLSEHGFS